MNKHRLLMIIEILFCIVASLSLIKSVESNKNLRLELDRLQAENKKLEKDCK